MYDKSVMANLKGLNLTWQLNLADILWFVLQ